MESAAAFLKRLGRSAGPGRRRFVFAAALSSFGLLLWAMPVAAFGWRATWGRPDRPLLITAWLLGLTGVFALVLGLMRAWKRRPEPYALARAADVRLGSEELVLTATDVLLTDAKSLFTGSVVRLAERAMENLEPESRPRMPWVLPPLRRLGGALFLSWLVLWVPSASHGLFGPERSGVEPGATAATDSPKDTEGAGSGTSDAGGQGPRLSLTSRTDRKLYLFGEEVQLDVTVSTLQELPRDLPLVVSVHIDGREIGSFPLDRGASRHSGAQSQERHPLTPLLRAAGLYQPGIHKLEVRALADTPPGEKPITLDAPPSSFRIAENVEKQRRPTTASRPKPPPLPKDSKSKRAGRSPKKEKRRPKPSPKKGAGKSAMPPKAKEKPYVVEPLFAGNQTSKRKVRVFDRAKTEGEPPPSRTPDARSSKRNYRKLDLQRWKRMPLRGRERRIVETYFRRLTGGEADH